MMTFINILFIINWLYVGWNAETKLWKIVSMFCIMISTFTLAYSLNIIGSYKSPLDIRWEVYHCQENLPAYQKCVITVSKPIEK